MQIAVWSYHPCHEQALHASSPITLACWNLFTLARFGPATRASFVSKDVSRHEARLNAIFARSVTMRYSSHCGQPSSARYGGRAQIHRMQPLAAVPCDEPLPAASARSGHEASTGACTPASPDAMRPRDVKGRGSLHLDHPRGVNASRDRVQQLGLRQTTFYGEVPV